MGDLDASALTGTLTVTTGDASDDSITITTGSNTTSITDSFGKRHRHGARVGCWRSNTLLTLIGTAAFVVDGLVGDLDASALTGTLTVTTGDAIDNGITITTGSSGDLDHRQLRQRHRDGARRPARQQHAADADRGRQLRGRRAEGRPRCLGADRHADGDDRRRQRRQHHHHDRIEHDLDHRQFCKRHRHGACVGAGAEHPADADWHGGVRGRRPGRRPRRLCAHRHADGDHRRRHRQRHHHHHRLERRPRSPTASAATP